ANAKFGTFRLKWVLQPSPSPRNHISRRLTMLRRPQASVFAVSIGVCAIAAGLAVFPAVSGQALGSERQPGPPSQAPSEAEMKARTDGLIANQHTDDEAIEEYEHVEREIDRSGGPDPRTVQDRTFRVVPTGTGTLRILLKDNGKATDPDDYRRQLQAWRDVLQLALHPDDPRSKTAYTKFEKKKRDKQEIVDWTRDAEWPRLRRGSTRSESEFPSTLHAARSSDALHR